MWLPLYIKYSQERINVFQLKLQEHSIHGASADERFLCIQGTSYGLYWNFSFKSFQIQTHSGDTGILVHNTTKNRCFHSNYGLVHRLRYESLIANFDMPIHGVKAT